MSVQLHKDALLAEQLLSDENISIIFSTAEEVFYVNGINFVMDCRLFLDRDLLKSLHSHT